MDETRYDPIAHQSTDHPTADHPIADHSPDHHRTATSRRGLVALTIVIGLVALVGGAMVGASIGGSDSGDADVAVAPETSTTTSTEAAAPEESGDPAGSPEDPITEADPVEDPTPTTEPDDPDSDPTPDPDDDGVVVTKIPPGVFLPSIGFDEVIDMGPASSAQWTLTNTGLGNASWSITGGSGLSFGSPGNDWVIIPAGTLEPGESITITVGLADSPGPGAWSKGFSLNHPGGPTEIDVVGHKPLLILPES